MRVLFTSAGSIGSRHIKNLYDISTNKGITVTIDAVRYSDRVLPENVRKCVSREIHSDADLNDHYDIVFITDETRTHYDNIMKFKDKCHHMFIEKPLFDSINYPMENLKRTNDKVYYVAAPIRFSQYFEALKTEVSKNDIYSARIIFSSYMPNWQKGRDYRKSFRCFRDRGGGVDIDSLHEIDYMKSLFGLPKSINLKVGKYSNLEMEACDIATYIFEYDDKLVEMHLDYFGRTNNRRTELYAKDDVIVVDFNKKSVEHQLTGEVRSFAPDDQFYQNEMSYFLDLVTSNGKIENINTPEMAYETLKLSKGII